MRESTLVVVGGGIAGLTAAWAARKPASGNAALRVVVLEGGDRVGGKVWTQSLHGRNIEWGPDAFVAAKPEARQLATELGFDDELIGPSDTRKTYLWLRGKLRQIPPGLAMGVPTGVLPLARAVREGIVGPVAALRAGIEPLLPGAPGGADRSVGQVARRRLGARVARRLVDPLVGGVYGAPADQVSLRVAMPQLASKRSLLMAVARGPRPAGPVFLTPRGGMGRFVERLSEELKDVEVRTSTAVCGLARDGAGWRVATQREELVADAVVLAVPAPSAAQLVAGVAPDVAGPLRGIRYRDSVIVHLRYPHDAPPSPPDAWGYLRAAEEDGIVAAATFVATKWPHLREDGLRIRAVVNESGAVSLPDDVLGNLTAAEVGRTLGMRRAPDEVLVHRWTDAMPVYEPGHLDRVAAARAALPASLALAGASYEGVGVPDCIRTGRAAAARILEAVRA